MVSPFSSDRPLSNLSVNLGRILVDLYCQSRKGASQITKRNVSQRFCQCNKSCVAFWISSGKLLKAGKILQKLNEIFLNPAKIYRNPHGILQKAFEIFLNPVEIVQNLLGTLLKPVEIALGCCGNRFKSF